MSNAFYDSLQETLNEIEADGLYKRERVITSQQYSKISVRSGDQTRNVLNFCANNYLGLANNPQLIEAAKTALDRYGYGVASVRFICGAQEVHRELEQRLAAFTGQEDAILYAAAFDANGGVFEPLLGPDDAVISDSLNHASIIDGVRLCKAKRYRYANSDMNGLEAQLKQARADGAKTILIVTDGVFSMDGYIADLKSICDLADKFDALTMVDDCHAHGFMGPNGRGTAEHCGVLDRIDIVTGTLGKALGGAMGGFTAAKQPVIDMLRQRSRPYLFSNSLAPAITAASLRALDLVEARDDLRAKLFANARQFRTGMGKAGFDLLPGEHPIVPVMLGDAALSQKMADGLMDEGVYVIGFFYPVVPKGKARIRTQMSAAHTPDMIDQAVSAFTKVGKQLDVI
jgi:glycine C-acetyltransferase